MDKNLLANAGDKHSIPGLGQFHMPEELSPSATIKPRACAPQEKYGKPSAQAYIPGSRLLEAQALETEDQTGR